MGLSRRKSTKEFKIAALRQLDAGASITAVARFNSARE
jgi:transposase-like protein